VGCEHPDHAFDGPVDLDWLMFGVDLGRDPDDIVITGPVVL